MMLRSRRGKTRVGPARPIEASFFQRFLKQRTAVVALCFLLVVIAWATTASLTYDLAPFEVHLDKALAPPDANAWFGRDDIGRDMYSRMVMATRLSLLGAVQAVLVATAVGLPIGVLSGYFGKWFDTAAMRVVDILLVFPTLIFAIVLIGVMGASLTSASIAIGLGYAPHLARIVRGTTMAVRKSQFVLAAHQMGVRDLRSIATHILPNIASALNVQLTLMLGLALLSEAGLSFLGLGVQDPEATWGALLRRSFSFMHAAPALTVFPGAMIMLTVLSFNLLGDGIRDAIGRVNR